MGFSFNGVFNQRIGGQWTRDPKQHDWFSQDGRRIHRAKTCLCNHQHDLTLSLEPVCYHRR